VIVVIVANVKVVKVVVEVRVFDVQPVLARTLVLVACDAELVLGMLATLVVMPNTSTGYTPSPTSESMCACSCDSNELTFTVSRDSFIVAAPS
jgi:hypothetical protein